MISLKQYYMGRDVWYASELTDELRSNAVDLLSKVNQLLKIYCAQTKLDFPGVRSGWRPKEVNDKIPHAAKHSKHITCNAIDVADNLHKFSSWCLHNLNELERIGLWMESPEFTPTWCHLQRLSVPSGHRVFIP